MQELICGGCIVLAVIVLIIIFWPSEPSGPVTLRRHTQPINYGGSGASTVDVWDEIKAQGQPALSTTQAANRAELARAAQLWELTGHEGLPEVSILPRGQQQLGPGEASVIVVLTPGEKDGIERR